MHFTYGYVALICVQSSPIIIYHNSNVAERNTETADGRQTPIIEIWKKKWRKILYNFETTDETVPKIKMRTEIVFPFFNQYTFILVTGFSDHSFIKY